SSSFLRSFVVNLLRSLRSPHGLLSSPRRQPTTHASLELAQLFRDFLSKTELQLMVQLLLPSPRCAKSYAGGIENECSKLDCGAGAGGAHGCACCGTDEFGRQSRRQHDQVAG